MARTKEFYETDILDRAIELFSDKGYNGISMQELVDGLSLNRSSIYDTFGDKRSLFVAALKHYKQKNATEMEAMINASQDIGQTLVEIFDYIIAESFSNTLNSGCFMVNASVELAPHEKTVREIVCDNSSVIQDALKKAIKKAQLKKQVTSTLPASALAKFFFTTFNGMRVSARAGASKKDLEAVARVALSALE